MNSQSNTEIFISYASDDLELAKLIKQLLVKSLKLSNNQVFYSGDEKSIRTNTIEYDRITEALRSAKVVIALMTPNSIYRQWVLFESGGAHFSPSDKLFLVYANGINPKSLPAPLKPSRAQDLSKRNIIKEPSKGGK